MVICCCSFLAGFGKEANGVIKSEQVVCSLGWCAKEADENDKVLNTCGF